MVRSMISRIYAASFVVVLAVGVMLVPNETFGRSGGSGARSFPFVSGFRPSPLRPTVHAARRSEPALLHRREDGFGLRPFWLGGFGAPLALPGGSFTYDPDYNPGSFSEPYYRADEPDIVTGSVPLRMNPYRPGCRTETVTVPAESGGESSINIVRC
jgi:hypothetical protein